MSSTAHQDSGSSPVATNPVAAAAEQSFDPLGQLAPTAADLMSDSELRAAVEGALHDVAIAARSAGRGDAVEVALLLTQLCQILSVSEPADGEHVGHIAEFVARHVPSLHSVLSGQEDGDLNGMAEEARRSWGELLELTDVAGFESEAWSDLASEETEQGEDDEELSAPSEQELSLILSALSGSEDDPSSSAEEEEPSNDTRSPATFDDGVPATFPVLDATAGQPELEGELLEAYLDDASRCLAGIESAALAFAQKPDDRQALQQICRELHTLKGASASVELSVLADYLHRVEEYVQANCDEGASVEPANLLATVDVIRSQMAELQPTPTASSESNTAIVPRADEGGHDAEETVRVKASQLDRLMDLLAELVMLRNGRESSIGSLQHLNDELTRCSTRLRFEGDVPGHSVAGTNPVREVANDVLEISRAQREICDQVVGENLAVTRFIRNFRQELTEVRRLPISGLFRRLQRAVHDAASIEGKQVRLELVGEHAGLERSLQERLYEPLLHIVRNSVGHGIEDAATRTAAGKDPCGTVTLEARGASNLLILEVRDDGRGLDYDALRRRGIERGILPADQPATREELAQLIFHPGFSTRESANAVAGRGVGMDVVAESLSKMRAWVEVQSEPGQGTKIRLSIPLRSVIEHTMVFRCGGQLFAVPMQFVREASQPGPNAGSDQLTSVRYSELFGQPSDSEETPGHQITLGYGRKLHQASGDVTSQTSGRQFAILVDEIVGPEEVVVRPLPPLLRHQSLVSGVTLSGSGELLLLLDSQRLIELGLRRSAGRKRSDRSETATPIRPTLHRVLVVDDSISARRCVARAVRHFGLETVEAADGQEALALLAQGGFAAVFSDLDMPHMNGFELLREVSSRDLNVPVTIVSSRSEEECKSQAIEFGAVAYFTKPASEARVGEVLGRLGLLAGRGDGEKVQ